MLKYFYNQVKMKTDLASLGYSKGNFAVVAF
jgi:hypothetical protein